MRDTEDLTLAELESEIIRAVDRPARKFRFSDTKWLSLIPVFFAMGTVAVYCLPDWAWVIQWGVNCACWGLAFARGRERRRHDRQNLLILEYVVRCEADDMADRRMQAVRMWMEWHQQHGAEYSILGWRSKL